MDIEDLLGGGGVEGPHLTKVQDQESATTSYPCILTDREATFTHLLSHRRLECRLVIVESLGGNALLLIKRLGLVDGLLAEGGFGSAKFSSEGLIEAVEVREEATRYTVLLYKI